MNAPRVSVCIPTYNRAHHLPDAIESILAQTFGDFELVISDNASTDHTSEVLQRYRDPRIRIHRNATNLGLVGNFNRCVELARAPYVVLCCSDDYWAPLLLEREMTLFEQHPGLSYVHVGSTNVDESGKLLFLNILDLPPVTPGLVYFRRLLLEDLNGTNFSSVLYRKEYLQEAGGFDPQLPLTQDLALWARLALRGDVGYVAEPLVFFRKHSGNFHQNWSEAEYLKERMRLAEEIFGRWPQAQEPALAGLGMQVKDRLARDVLEALVAVRLGGERRRDIAELFWRANAMRTSALPKRCLLKTASALVFAPAMLVRVVAHFGKTSRQLRTHHSEAH